MRSQNGLKPGEGDSEGTEKLLYQPVYPYMGEDMGRKKTVEELQELIKLREAEALVKKGRGDALKLREAYRKKWLKK